MRAALGEFLADAFWTPPHRDDLHPPLTHLPERQLTFDTGVVELFERAVDRGGGRGVAEPVGAEQPPVPVLPRVGLGVAGRKQDGGFDVAAEVVDPKVELEIRPVIRKRVDDLLEGLGESHRGRAYLVLAIESIGMAVEAPPDIKSGYGHLREQAGVVKPESWLTVEVKGPDAVEFLQGQVTNDVAALERGVGCYALLLNPKGRILADMRILMRSPEELWLDGQAAPMEAVASHLKMYRIGRQVEISPVPRSDRDIISVIGPRARDRRNSSSRSRTLFRRGRPERSANDGRRDRPGHRPDLRVP